MRLIALPIVMILASWHQASYAQQCGETYVTTEGDNLYSISRAAYDDERKWSALYYANQNLLGHDPGNVANGVGLRIPCLDTESAPDPTPFQRLNADLKLLTGGDYAPFTDQDLPGGGLLTELVNASFDNSPSPVTFSLTWEDEWSLHLSPLLQNRVFDVGFPWFQPNCAENKEDFRCSTFHFSEPLFEMLIPLYVNVDNPIDFQSDADVEGKTLCRPAGYFTHDLDRGDRRWLTDNKINFVQAETIDDCFEKLVAQEVDAVTINEFTGRLKIQVLNLQDKVVASERPLSIEGLHVLIAKSHPRGTTFLYRFNAGLAELKKSKRYSEIIERHLSNYWTQIENPAVTEATDEKTEDATSTSESSDSTQSLDEPESPAVEDVQTNQQGAVEPDNAAESETASVTTEIDDSQPPALSEDEADIKKISKQTEMQDETDSSMEEPTSVEESTTVEETSEPSADASEMSTSGESNAEMAATAKDETDTDSNEGGTEIASESASESAADEPIDEGANTVDADTETLNADSASALESNDSKLVGNEDGEVTDEVADNESVDAEVTDVAAATPATEQATDSRATDETEQAVDAQATDEATIRSKRCKALPYFCRMFGLD